MSDDINLGRHTLEQRNEFIDRKTAKYLQRHPGAKRQKARKYAKVKWARKIRSETEAVKHVNRIRIKT